MSKAGNIEIRRYQDSDEDAVISLWEEAFPNDPPRNEPLSNIKMKMTYQPYLFFVALLDGELAGTVMAGYEGHRGWVNFMAVSKTFRQCGIGAALMKHAEKELRTIGCIKLNLQIRTGNSEVVEFYEALGYHVEEIISMGKTLVDDFPPGK